MAKIKVFSPSYNSNVFCVNNINSVIAQTHGADEHYYIDDRSEEESVNILKKVRELAALNKDTKKNLKISFNKDRKYKLLNLYEYVSLCDDDDIICVLDGDDWLCENNVLEKIYDQYKNHNARYVYTNWKYSHNEEVGISRKIPSNEWDPYKDQWVTSAMSTFRAAEFKKIPLTNFLRWDNEWFSMGCDQAYVLPILWNIKKETGGYGSVKFIDEPLYVYQFLENPLKSRGTDDGGMRIDAHNSVTFIRERGYVEDKNATGL